MSEDPATGGLELRMITLEGRDPLHTHQVMARLFALATERGLQPLQWDVGFFNLRDLRRVHRDNMVNEGVDRPAIYWGASLRVVSLEDHIELLAAGGGAMERFVYQESDGSFE